MKSANFVLRSVLSLILLLTVILSARTQVQVPTTINIQGVLTNVAGVPVTNGVYSISFRLYNSAQSDVILWLETQSDVNVAAGVFSTQLGKISPLTLPFDQTYFLGIKLGQNPEMSPRIELTAVPYSLMAKNIEDNSISTGKLQNNAVTLDKIVTPLISSINGITNDGGNVNLVAGANVSITTDNVNKSITISSTGEGGGGTGSILQLTDGNGINIQNPTGPVSAIGLKPNIQLGPGGSLHILNQNSAVVTGITTNSANQGGSITTSNAQGTQMFGVTNFNDGQPLLFLNNRLGRQIVDLKANESSDAELNLKSGAGSPTVQLRTNENAGGIINVFNQRSNAVSALTTTSAGNGRLMLSSVDNVLVLDLKTNIGGGGFLSLFNDESTEAVRLSTAENRGGIISVRNRAGNTAVNLSTNNVGDGGLFVRSGANTAVGDLSVNTNGGGFFSISNQDPVEIFRITTTAQRQGSMRMNNRLGNLTAELTSNQFSDGEFRLHSVLTNPTVLLTANNNAGGLINIFNQQGLIAAQATELDGNGDLRINNELGEEKVRINTMNGSGRINLNNRLGNSVALIKSNAFSDGELTLNSVLKTPTIQLTANDNAGGLFNLFSQQNKLSARLTELEGSGDFKLFNPQNIDIVNLRSFLGDGSLLLKNKLGFESAGIEGSTLGGFMYVTDGTKTNGLNLRAVLNGGVGGGELELYNAKGVKTFFLTTNFNSEGLLQIRSKSDKTKSRIELGSAASESGFLTIFNKDTKGILNLQADAITQEGLIRISSKAVDTLDRARLGGDVLGNGYLNLFNSKGLKTSFLGHNEFGDGSIELKSHLGNTGGYFTAFQDGGSIAVTDGKPGTNHRALMGNTIFGGRTAIFNANNLMTHESTVQQNGEGIFRIANPKDIIKSRVEIGGSANLDGFVTMYNNKNQRSSDLTSNADGSGMIATYKDEKKQTQMNSSSAGGEINVYNNGGNITSQVGHFEDGRGKIEVGFSNGTKVARMTANTDGSGYIGIDNTDKNEVVRITANTGKGGGIGVKNALNKDIVTITQNLNHGSILVNNASGNNTGAIAHFDDGRGKIEVGAADGTKVVRMTANTDGSGFIGVDNVDKKEVVRITANNGKGGGIGIRNNLGNDIINLTQDNAFGALLINNAVGSLISTLTHNSLGGGFMGNKDQNGKDAVWITTNTNGGGNVTTFNESGKVATSLSLDGANHGKVAVHGTAGNEIARMTSTTKGEGLVTIDNGSGVNLAGMTTNANTGVGYLYTKDANGKELARMTSAAGTGIVNIDNSAGFNLAGLTNNSSSGAGYVFANNSTGKEVARMTGTTAGNGFIGINNSASTNLGGINMNNSSGGGYLFANHSTGKEVARMSSLTTGDGYVSVDNAAGNSVSFLSVNNASGGYIGVANSSGGTDRARLATSAGGTGYISVGNATGKEVVELSVTTSNHGTVATYNANGSVIAGLLASTSGQGYIRASNASGSERAYMNSGDLGGTVAVRDNGGNQRVTLSGGGNMEVTDADGSYLSAYSTGSGVNLILVDKMQHARAEVKSGTILAKGPNGVEHSFMSSATAPNLGYIGVCNSNLVGSPVKAGMYTNANNQGILFADVKNFKMDYPGKPDKQIWYGSLEGPELAAYIRGTGKMINGSARIDFPDHYIQVANAGTMTVIVSPLSSKSKGIAVVKKSNTGFEVEELLDGTGTYEFDWEVKCVRKGYEGFEVVRNKSDEPKPFIPDSDGPTTMEPRSNTNLQADQVIQQKITRQQ